MATGRRKERKMNSKKKKRGREKGMVEVRGDGEKRGERGRLEGKPTFGGLGHHLWQPCQP